MAYTNMKSLPRAESRKDLMFFVYYIYLETGKMPGEKGETE